MRSPAYRITLGSTTIESSRVTRDEPVVLIRTDADLTSPAPALDVWLGADAGVRMAAGDPASVELGYANAGSRATVFTGTIDRVHPDLRYLHVQALADTVTLTRLRVNQGYEDRSAGQIVSDLANQAGIQTDTVQNGIDVPFYVVDDSRSAYEHCRDLAERAGFDLYTTPEGKLMFAGFSGGTADHTFTYADDVLALEVAQMPAPYERVEVWGESPASSEGADAASWLARNSADFAGSAGSGPILRLSDPAIRTKDAADASAKGRLDVITRRATFGVAVVLGAAEVAAGDAITFRDVPDRRLGGVLQVKRVTHRFSKTAGFTTRFEFWGSGGGPGGF